MFAPCPGLIGDSFVILKLNVSLEFSFFDVFLSPKKEAALDGWLQSWVACI